MDLIATRVYILTFDTHVFIQPFWKEKIFSKSFNFMNDPNLYSSMLINSTAINSGGVTCTPVTSLPKNNFWKKIAPVFLGRNYHKFLPFNLKIPSIKVKINDEILPGCNHGKVEASYLIWDWGWSSLIDIDIIGNFDCNALTNLSNMLISRKQDKKFFIIGEKKVKLSSVYKQMQQELFNHITINAPTQPIVDDRQKNHFIFTIVSTGGDSPPLPFSELPADEQASIFSILMGKFVSVDEFATPNKFKIVPLKGGFDYALLKYDKGTLMMMADSFSKKIENHTDISCFSANVRAYTAMMYMLQTYIDISKDYGIEEVEKSATNALKIIPLNYKSPYTNIFCCKDNHMLSSLSNPQL